MTARIDHRLRGPPGPPPHPPECPQQALPARQRRTPRAPRPRRVARRSTSPSSSIGPGRCPGPSCTSRRAAVEEAIGRLQPDDRFSVVVYDDVVDVVCASTTASTEARRGAIDRLRDVEARGSTNLAEGWLRGCEQVAAHLATEGVNRCLLLTDGLANVGITDPDQLARHARELPRSRGVDDDVRGRQRLRRAPAAGARRCRRRPLLLHRRRPADPRRDHVRGRRDARDRRPRRQPRDHGARRHPDRPDQPVRGHAPAATGRRSRSATSSRSRSSRSCCGCRSRTATSVERSGRSLALTDRDGVFDRTGRPRPDPVRVTWTYADDRANDAQPRDRDVDRSVARCSPPGRARKRAAQPDGDFDGARRALAIDRGRIRGYAGDDAEIGAPRSTPLEDDAPVFSPPPMAEHEPQAGAFRERQPAAQPRRVRAGRSSAPNAWCSPAPPRRQRHPEESARPTTLRAYGPPPGRSMEKGATHALVHEWGRARDPHGPGPAAARRRCQSRHATTPDPSMTGSSRTGPGTGSQTPCRATSCGRMGRSGRAKRPPKPPPGGGSGNVVGASWNAGGPILARSGQVLFTMDGGNWICSGSVVDDGDRPGYSLVLTAGHCAIDETDGRFATNWMFIPAFDTAPTYTCSASMYGCWTAVGLAVHNQFATAGSFNNQAVTNDWALAIVGPGGKSGSAQLDATVGSLSDRVLRRRRMATSCTRSAIRPPASTTAATSSIARGPSSRTPGPGTRPGGCPAT